MSTLSDVQKARIELWKHMPLEVQNLSNQRTIMQPAGRTLSAEGETRVLTELLYLLLAGLEEDKMGEEIVRPMLDSILEHFTVRFRGWYGLMDAASILVIARRVIVTGEDKQVREMLRELTLYVGRLYHWIDLLIPWDEINELMRAEGGQISGTLNE